MLHYDGTSWQRFDSGTEFELGAVSVVTPTAAWAAGKGGAMVHWDGAAWQSISSGTTDDIRAIWAFAANDIWRATASGVAHYNGTQWSSAASPACARFWASGPQDLYCYAGAQAWRWDGQSWTSLGFSQVGTFRALWGNGPSSAVFVSDPGATYRATATTLQLADYETTPEEVVRGLWAPTGGNFVAVGETEEKGPIWTFSSNTWQPSNTPAIATPIGQGMPGSAALASSGTIWIVQRSPSVASWDGSTMTQHAAGTDQLLYSVAVGPGDDVWAGGQQGVVTHLVGGTFQASSVGAPFDVDAIWIDQNGNPWVGGGAGRVFVRNGSSWQNRSAAGMATLKAIWGRSPMDVYAGGSGVFHYDGSWTDLQFEGNNTVDAVWTVGEKLFAFDGAVWELVGEDWILRGAYVGVEGPTFVHDGILWTVRDSPKVDRWNGSKWDHFRLPDSSIYYPPAIAARPDGQAWVFGPGSAVRHYEP